MIKPTEDQKRKPHQFLEGTPGGSVSRRIAPADATSNKPNLEERRTILAEIGLYFTSIGWLVHQDGRGLIIEQGDGKTSLQNLPFQDQ